MGKQNSPKPGTATPETDEERQERLEGIQERMNRAFEESARTADRAEVGTSKERDEYWRLIKEIRAGRGNPLHDQAGVQSQLAAVDRGEVPAERRKKPRETP